jgi:hypothetical protein
VIYNETGLYALSVRPRPRPHLPGAALELPFSRRVVSPNPNKICLYSLKVGRFPDTQVRTDLPGLGDIHAYGILGESSRCTVRSGR